MLTFWVGEFGLVIPRRTGVRWHQQTGGVCCDQVYVEGIFLPLNKPMVWKKGDDDVDLLAELREANYKIDEWLVADVWEKIDGVLDFKYVEVEAPQKQPGTQEGIKWIVIKKIKYPKMKSRKKYDRIVWKSGCSDLDEMYKDLIGKTVAMVYPNSD